MAKSKKSGPSTTLELLLASDYDEEAQEKIAEAPNLSVPWFLMASYTYYILNKSILSDTYYDQLSHFILDNWDTLEHRHKHLLDKNGLEAGTAYYLKKDDYPWICRSAAEGLIEKLDL